MPFVPRFEERRLQFGGPIHPELKHTLNTLGESQLAFFIYERGLIDDLHERLENGRRFQFIMLDAIVRGNEFFAVAVHHLQRLA